MSPSPPPKNPKKQPFQKKPNPAKNSKPQILLFYLLLYCCKSRLWRLHCHLPEPYKSVEESIFHNWYIFMDSNEATAAFQLSLGYPDNFNFIYVDANAGFLASPLCNSTEIFLIMWWGCHKDIIVQKVILRVAGVWDNCKLKKRICFE